MGLYDFLLSFFLYGFLGWCTEVAFAAVKTGRFVNRGFLNGPICPVYGIGVGLVVWLLSPIEDRLILLYVASTALVTLLEWGTGVVLDRIFHHKWWDYSDQPFNIGGYVCLPFSLVWGVGCVLIMKFLHPLAQKGIDLLPVPLGILLIVVFGAALAADLSVTVSSILKLNRQLETMEKVAAELRELSDKVGSNIYENVSDAMEKREEGRRRLEEAADQGRQKWEELTRARQEQIQRLRARYEELSLPGNRVSARLLKAFPRMESRRHKAMLEELKKRMRGRR